jgi:hypothetical protein
MKLIIGRDRGTACPLFDGTNEIGQIDCGDIVKSRKAAHDIAHAVNVLDDLTVQLAWMTEAYCKAKGWDSSKVPAAQEDADVLYTHKLIKFARQL